MTRFARLLATELRRFASRHLVRTLAAGAVIGAAAVITLVILRGGTIRYPDALTGTLAPLGMVLILMGTAIGASLVAAEWANGSLAGALLFEPSRWRLLLARAAAGALGCAAMAVLVLVSVTGLLALGAAVSGTFEHQPELTLAEDSPEAWILADDGSLVENPDAEYVDVGSAPPGVRSVATTIARVAAAAALAAVFGVGAGTLVRRTAGVVGAVLLSYVIADTAVAAMFDAGYFWGPGRALIAVGTGAPDVIAFSAPSGPYVVFAFAWTAGVMVAALVWFSRAEVTTNAR